MLAAEKDPTMVVVKAELSVVELVVLKVDLMALIMAVVKE